VQLHKFFVLALLRGIKFFLELVNALVVLNPPWCVWVVDVELTECLYF